jgi:hypothetical protein
MRKIVRREKMNDVILINICFLFAAMSRLVGLGPSSLISYTMNIRDSFPGLKWMGREGDNSIQCKRRMLIVSPKISNFKKMWGTFKLLVPNI